MAYPTRGSKGTQLPQNVLESLKRIDTKCLRDDRYFKLLYMNYDNNFLGLNSRVNHSDEVPNINAESNRSDWRRTEKEIKEIKAELSLIKQKFDNLELSMESLRMGTENDILMDAPACSYSDINPIDAALSSRAQDLPTSISRSGNASVNSCLRCPHIEPLPEMPAHSLALLDRLNILGDNEAATPFTFYPFRSASSERNLVEQSHNQRLSAVSEPYKCPVCLKCVQQRKPASTICGHVFCSSCIRTVLRATCKCPVCQSFITTREIFRIYI
ncbi:E3 ubiquitin-protein ligase BRE1-like [Drosophila grimshawi]|uniref:E3 ubiquitin-protein ligase BRE1-like n=1 Tax=Drosophila grimshawi TaxID=7222 RepID=UPI000C871550|nr:E3 ubiquitin-protein ligase BRE1-like [Drosophila grimshawi]